MDNQIPDPNTRLVETLHRAVKIELDREINKIVDSEVKEAIDRVTKRIRGMTGKIATEVSAHVNFMERFNELVITVKNPEPYDRNKDPF